MNAYDSTMAFNDAIENISPKEKLYLLPQNYAATTITAGETITLTVPAGKYKVA